jgi:hypothetical protein
MLEDFLSRLSEGRPRASFSERIIEIPLAEDGPESVIRFESQLCFL